MIFLKRQESLMVNITLRNFSDVCYGQMKLLTAFYDGIDPLSVFRYSCIVSIFSWLTASFTPTEKPYYCPSPRTGVLHNERTPDVSKTGIFWFPFKASAKSIFFSVRIDCGLLAFFVGYYGNSDLSKFC